MTFLEPITKSNRESKKSNHLMYVFTGVFFVSLSVFIFRGALEPGIIVFEDYFPFSSLKQLTDYYGGGWNDYTQTLSVRDYSIFFFWARYLDETAFVLVSAISGTLLTLASIQILRIVFPNLKNSALIISSILPATFVLLLMLYTKLSSFYMLVMGQALFAVALSFYLRVSYNRQTNILSNCLLVGLLLWTIPAPHYVVLFYACALVLSCVFTLYSRNSRYFLILGLTAAIHLIPYLILQGSSISYSELVPVNYSLIANTGASPEIFVSSIQTSSVEKYIFGAYGPRFDLEFALFSIAITAFAFIAIFIKKTIVRAIAVLYAVSFVFALGVNGAYSVLIEGLELPVLGSLFNIIIEVLRQPSRWQFVELYSKMLLFAISTALVLQYLQSKNTKPKSILAGVLAAIIGIATFLPFALSDYDVVFSGDFGKAIAPVNAPPELEHIRNIIKSDQMPTDKLLVLNPAIPKLNWSGNTVLVQESFYAYYFDIPSIRWSISSTTIENLLYGSYAYSILINNRDNDDIASYYALQNIRWIFLHDGLLSTELIPEETQTIISRLSTSKDIELVYDSGGYYLFENHRMSPSAHVKSGTMTIALSKPNIILDLLSNEIGPEETILVPAIDGRVTFSDFKKYSENLKGNLLIYMESPDYTLTDLVLATTLKESMDYALPTNLLLLEKHGWITSNQFNVYYKTNIAYEKVGPFGPLGATDGAFILGTKKDLSADFMLQIPEDGQYHIYMKMIAPRGASVSFTIDEDERTMLVPKISENYRFIEIYYGFLTQGTHTLSVKKLDSNPLTMNLAYPIENSTLTGYLNEMLATAKTNSNRLVTNSTEIVNEIHQTRTPSTSTLVFSTDSLYYDGMNYSVRGQEFDQIPAWMVGSSTLIPFELTDGDQVLQSYPTRLGIFPYGILISAGIVGILVLNHKIEWLYCLARVKTTHRKKKPQRHARVERS